MRLTRSTSAQVAQTRSGGKKHEVRTNKVRAHTCTTLISISRNFYRCSYFSCCVTNNVDVLLLLFVAFVVLQSINSNCFVFISVGAVGCLFSALFWCFIHRQSSTPVNQINFCNRHFICSISFVFFSFVGWLVCLFAGWAFFRVVRFRFRFYRFRLDFVREHIYTQHGMYTKCLAANFFANSFLSLSLALSISASILIASYLMFELSGNIQFSGTWLW